MKRSCHVASKPDSRFLIFDLDETGKRQGPPRGPFVKERALIELAASYGFNGHHNTACKLLEAAERGTWASSDDYVTALEPGSDSFVRDCDALSKAIVDSGLTHLSASLPDARFPNAAKDLISKLINVLATQDPKYRTPSAVRPAVQRLLSDREQFNAMVRYIQASTLEAPTIHATARFAIDHTDYC